MSEEVARFPQKVVSWQYEFLRKALKDFQISLSPDKVFWSVKNWKACPACLEDEVLGMEVPNQDSPCLWLPFKSDYAWWRNRPFCFDALWLNCTECRIATSIIELNNVKFATSGKRFKGIHASWNFAFGLWFEGFEQVKSLTALRYGFPEVNPGRILWRFATASARFLSLKE